MFIIVERTENGKPGTYNFTKKAMICQYRQAAGSSPASSATYANEKAPLPGGSLGGGAARFFILLAFFSR